MNHIKINPNARPAKIDKSDKTQDVVEYLASRPEFTVGTTSPRPSRRRVIETSVIAEMRKARAQG
jgi:hypothetical protein